MRRFLLPLLVSLFYAPALFAQSDLFGTTTMPARKGFILGVNGGVDLPGGDLADRFGTSYRLGPSVLYKTTSNWLVGVKWDFILGNKIKDDSLMRNISDAQGFFINNQGQRVGVGGFERGYAAGVQAGKILVLNKANPNSGILILTGLGFIQHRINIFDRDKAIPQLNGEYRKGYDRLTNGWYAEQFVGYNLFSKSGFFNFHLGLDLLAGFTKGRRDYQYDLMRRDDAGRVDLLFGLRGGWYIPIFKKKSEEILFE